MPLLIVLVLAGLAVAESPNGAIEGSVTLKGPGASPVMVYLEGDGPPAVIEGNKEVAQRSQRFEPKGLVIAKGESVAFPNRDTQYHNVFSDEPGSSFNLGLYGPDTSQDRRFDKTGPVHVWCHRHEEMSMQVLVLPNAWFSFVEEGRYRIEGVPAGQYTMVAWATEHNIERTEVTVSANGVVTHDFTLQGERFIRRGGFDR